MAGPSRTAPASFAIRSFTRAFFIKIYSASQPDYTGRVSVPVLWDRASAKIVSDESSEIIRMFNSAFDGVGAAAGDFYPAALRGEIDALNERIYATVNNGVYRAGFARNQGAYEEAARRCLRRWTGSRNTSRCIAGCAASASPKPTGGCSRR